MKYLIYILFLSLTSSLVAQNNVPEKYKYIIVNSNFDFVKKRDAYSTSSMTKFLFNKIGFEAYLDDDTIPDELAINKCKALFASVIDKSSAFTIKSIIQIKDCKGRVIFTSDEGSSKIKDYDRGYYQSISEAFKSVKLYKHKYDKVEQDNLPNIVSKPKKLVTKSVGVKKQETAKEAKIVVDKTKSQYPVLSPKANKTGYQLLNKEGQVVFTILKTSDKNKYFIKGKNGTFTESGNNIWVAEYYENDELVKKNFIVKF